MTADAAEPLTWTVVMPVKALSGAKSRMGSTDQSSPAPLAFAFFKDTVQAALACTAVSTVVVATGDDTIGNWASVRGCRVVGDDDHPGINAAAQWGARSAPAGSGIAVLVSDLPCLTADSLADVLMLAGLHARSFLADADGTGTTMWFASPGNPVASRFGPSSSAAHRSAGDVDLVAEHFDRMPGLAAARRDVDTADDLAAAALIGLGAHSSRALETRPTARR